MPATALDAVLNTPNVWRGRNCATVATPSLPTGYAELDLLLPGGGWPAGALTEIYVERPGIGELQLLMPAAARLTRDALWLAMIGPPYVPYAPALAACGVHLQYLLMLRSQSPDEQAWACEQLLLSGNCGAVLIWLEHLQERTLRRLQHAAERSGSIAILYRSRRAQPFSAAALRLHVGRNDGRTVISILKRRGGGTPPPVQLDLYGSLTRRSATMPLSRGPAETPRLQAAH
ncbi:MAG: translesion DNA synthesis-associated protein ImuA [Betaproteobacteria bacterium]|nr:translesion DNA synthesis-associated protein ImuA [Betaproteobacteria bacterium]